MSYLIKPEGYKPLLDLKQTELGIKQIKEFFQLNLSSELRLHFFVLGDFRGHFIDGVRQIADLVLEGRLNLDAVAAGGDSLGFFRDLRHRI